MLKKIILTISSLFFLYSTQINTYAAWKGLLEWTSGGVEKIRKWELGLNDIIWTIKWMIEIFLGLAWTISVIFVIIWAYKLLWWSTKWDITQWRTTIVMALTGFAISALAWFIVKFIFDNFG